MVARRRADPVLATMTFSVALPDPLLVAAISVADPEAQVGAISAVALADRVVLGDPAVLAGLVVNAAAIPSTPY